MDWIFLGIGILITAELFTQLPLNREFYRLVYTIQQAARILISSHISDHWKEMVLPRYALQIFTSSLILLILLILVFVPFGIILVLSEQAAIETKNLALSLRGIVFSIGICIIYFSIRSRIVKHTI
ncbi:MAG: hypothetical protein A3I13_01745 [Gammaproteobacteria bacterium RIFCSPLOWO2_02_FULL_47_50]|nr:MAG: hypothetical protein A2993_01970 [Gammaproteobacteria bacterium RIFCSPLOWO2_01_FULL_47_190]OGT71867.1 MAG: hypothetical protein A2W76_05110 [Gammaproteobacteria bacterium RIFCSPLOWO2_12_47_11]OGT79078.1 MAG: hypothetical protein A3I13_01745 [Gammaproteobacteria bacterium RIFCSPLOWO2_02_FULL_47_50]OGT87553.1 MAG: hypothetical protein A3G42_07190 [Gammaproteobacteria bacterium RIFCSPLOWO2_12_FULL_47_76]